MSEFDQLDVACAFATKTINSQFAAKRAVAAMWEPLPAPELVTGRRFVRRRSPSSR